MTAGQRDPALPALHIRPAQGWLNDPNGVCRIDGLYHVFFQYNPHAPRHESIHWGHVSSHDLLHWREEPIALHPHPGTVNQAGCWSGCVVDDGGTPTALYTAVGDSAQNASTAVATSDRTLRHWQQSDRAVMRPPDDPSISDVRDPFVFTFGGHRYAIQGAGHQSGRPQILLYGCDDLTFWTPLGALLGPDDPLASRVAPAQIWECPNLVEVDGRWVLIVSLWQSVGGSFLLAGVRYLLGDLSLRSAPGGGAEPGLRFTPTSGETLDDGPTFYAPLTLTEPGRVLLWAWAAEDGRSPQDVVGAGWAGVLTFPRELSVEHGRVRSRPAAELTALRGDAVGWEPGEPFAASAFEVAATGPATLSLDGEPVVVVPSATPNQPIRILVDGSLVETFAGGVPATSRAYPSATSTWKLTADPATTSVWRLAL